MRRIMLFAVAVIGLGVLPAGAQHGPQGIAFVQAPEMAMGLAVADTPEAGFTAATAQCVENGAEAEDCLPTNWCLPAGWSVDLFVMNEEGFHWHDFHCGLPSYEAAVRVAEGLCAPDIREGLIECLPVQFYDPDGTAQLPEG